MKTMKKLLPLLLCIMMVVAAFAVTASAAGAEPNVTVSISQTEVIAGDEITVTFGIKEMKGTSLAFGFDFDNTLLEVKSIPRKNNVKLWFETYDPDTEEWYEDYLAATTISTKAEANNSGHVGVAFAYDLPEEARYFTNEEEGYINETAVKVVFTAKASGSVELEMFETTAGTDGYKGTWPSAPACDHANTKLVSNADGKTHSVVCTNEACNGYVVKTEDCSGTDDGDHTTDVKCECGNTVIAGTPHSFLNEIRGKQLSAGDCVTPATYATKCDRCDVEDETKVITGETNPANHAGEKFCVDTPKNMSQHLVYCNKCGELWDSQNPYAPHEADEEGYCECGLFAVVQDFNGGQISTKPPYPEMTEEDWTYMVESELGGFDVTSMSIFSHGLSIFVEDEDIARMNLMFVKEGYKLVGLAYDAEGTQRYNGEDIEKPTTLYYVWEPLHTHAHDHYDITETTHQSICSCGEILGEAKEHDYTDRVEYPEGISAPHPNCHIEQRFCECGAFEQHEAEHFDDDKDGDCDGCKGHCCAVEIIPDTPATCFVDGWYGYAYCAGCGTTYEYDADREQLFHMWEGLDAWKTGRGRIPAAHTSEEIVYKNITSTTHDEYHKCCNTLIEAEVPHNFDNEEHKCACGKVEEFTLTVNVLGTGDTVELTVPYGANLLEVLAKAAEEGLIPALGDAVPVNDELCIGINIPTRYSYFDADEQDWIDISENDTMPASDYDIDQEIIFTGWGRPDTDQPWGYQVEDIQIEGWYKVDGAWYFFFMDEETGWSCRTEGLSRVPYPTAPINGILYAPDADALKYYKEKGKTFIDAEEAWFLFDEDGKFLFDETGMGDYNGATRYMVNGMLKWHPGLLKIDGEIYYFIGDETNGGNIAANGIIYLSYTNGIEGFKTGKPYSFVDGKLNALHGIIEDDNGKLHYYIDGQLQMGTGLTLIDENGVYIYVRSNGELAVGEYYVGNVKYVFGADGKSNGAKNGIIDGVYYIDGHVAYGAGLTAYNGGYIYVRSSGEVVKGRTYWITNTNGLMAPGKYEFDENGMMKAVKNGIVEENGALYYYVNNHIQYGAGLVKIGEDIYYVRSNGQLATGEYWVTNSNEAVTGMKAGKYNFGENGKLITE